jgi:hypothetical protein
MDFSKLGGRITPLWIVALFVTLTEAVLGYAITKTEGGVQIALTVFVICFALLVFSAFFLVLWFKPYVFYPPSEYSDGDPKKFVEAMLFPENRVAEQIQLAQKAGNEPANRDVLFGVMDSLIDDAHRQILILMHQDNLELPYINYYGARYEVARLNGSWASGGLNVQEFAKKLDRTNLLTIRASGPGVSLTQLGHEFAAWLLSGGRRADYLATPFGGWGERIVPEGMPPGFLDRQVSVRPPVPTQTASVPDPVPSQLAQTTPIEAAGNTES